MLQNAYFLAKIGADTAENEHHFAEILPKTDNYPTCQPAPAGCFLRRARRMGAVMDLCSDLRPPEALKAGPPPGVTLPSAALGNEQFAISQLAKLTDLLIN